MTPSLLSTPEVAGRGGIVRIAISPIRNSTRFIVDKDIFASEFVIRSEREKFKLVEIPVAIEEKRPPSINLMKRVPHVLKSLARLTWAIRVAGRS